MAKNRKVTRKKARVNRQDLTLRNLRALKARLADVERRLEDLESLVGQP